MPPVPVLALKPLDDVVDLKRVGLGSGVLPLRQVTNVQLVAVDHGRETQQRGMHEACWSKLIEVNLPAEEEVAECERERLVRAVVVRVRVNRGIPPSELCRQQLVKQLAAAVAAHFRSVEAK